jgi:RNA polymerase sigma factor (sigma-70 family)
VAIPALLPPEPSRSAWDQSAPAASEEQLVERCHAGSESAFATIVTRYEAMLTGHCARIVGRSAAEDAVQDAFIAAWAALAAGVEVRALRPWLFAIAHRKALYAKAHTRYAAELTDAIPAARSCAQEAADAARARTALAAVAALPASQREALIGSALHGRSGTQLARELGVSEPKVRQLVFHARERLRLAAAACLAPPLAILRLIRRAANTAGRAAAGPGSIVAGQTVKVGVVIAVAAAAVGAGLTLHATRATAPAPVRAGVAGLRAGSAAPDSSVLTASLDRPAVGALVAGRVNGTAAVARNPARLLLPTASIPRSAAAAGYATTPGSGTPPSATEDSTSQAGLRGERVSIATGGARRVETTVSKGAVHLRPTVPLLTRTVTRVVRSRAPAPRMVTTPALLPGSARNTTTAGVGAALGGALQRVDSAGQTVAGDATPLAQGAQGSGSVVQGAGTGAVVTGVAAVPPGLGATGTSGPQDIPGAS